MLGLIGLLYRLKASRSFALHTHARLGGISGFVTHETVLHLPNKDTAADIAAHIVPIDRTVSNMYLNLLSAPPNNGRLVALRELVYLMGERFLTTWLYVCPPLSGS